MGYRLSEPEVLMPLLLDATGETLQPGPQDTQASTTDTWRDKLHLVEHCKTFLKLRCCLTGLQHIVRARQCPQVCKAEVAPRVCLSITDKESSLCHPWTWDLNLIIREERGCVRSL